MIRIRLLNESQAIENYLNKKASKGYVVTSVVPFALVPPIYFTAFNFKKSNDINRKYRIDTRNVEDEDKQEYFQIFEDDGWQKLPGSINHLEPSKHIFYTDDPNKESIFSDDESLKLRNKNEALFNLMVGIFLCCAFISLQVLFPITSHYPNGIISFLSHNFYVIVAISIILISIYRYIRNK